MTDDVRLTMPVVRVLAALLAAPDEPRYGLELMQATGLASGSLYPILTRLSTAGWVGAEWEQADPAEAGRPARRYYLLTPNGVERARAALAHLHAQTAVPPARRRRATGGAAGRPATAHRALAW